MWRLTASLQKLEIVDYLNESNINKILCKAKINGSD